ncbi:hypothetical protein BHM03_00037643 [Ensete ventricosum]|nr:hypothetical protein BHM03_00037643 [Ensete ventricosum]
MYVVFTDLILKMGRLQSLRSFDAFPRAEEHLLKKTHSGAVGSALQRGAAWALARAQASGASGERRVKPGNRTRLLALLWSFTVDFDCQRLIEGEINRRRSIEGEIDRRRSIEGEKGTKKKRRTRKKKRLHTSFPRVVFARGRFFSHVRRQNVSSRGEKIEATSSSPRRLFPHAVLSRGQFFSLARKRLPARLKQPTANQVLQMKQVYGVLDVQRVAGNFHISVHGLNIFVAQQVSYLKSKLVIDVFTDT